MKKIINSIKKSAAVLMLLALVAVPFGSQVAHAVTNPNWNVSGSYIVNMEYSGTQYPHDMTLSEDSSGNLTGNGGSPAGANIYTWVVDSGSNVSGDAIHITAHYTATADAVTPPTTLIMDGTIAPDGTISGTWSDNYQGGARSGALSTVTGTAAGLSAEDFGVMDQSGVKGYTAGFGLTNANFAGVQSVVTQLYSGATLLQTDTLDGPNKALITGDQISSPFDVSGTFDYAADGYWSNVRGAEYGQTLVPTKVVATVTLADGRILTTENTNLTGDPSTIMPAPGTVKVTIVKYMDGGAATASNANSSSFAMNASWSAANIGTGTGQYNLTPTGFNNPAPYEATTADMSSGASYSTSEIMDGTTGVSCDVDNASPYSLVGYTSGDSLAAAAAASPSATVPAFTNLTSDKFVVVWNHDCANVNAGFITTNPATAITASDATLNGTNGSSAAIGHSFWASTSTFSTASPTLPSGVFSTPDLGPIAANTAFSALLSSVSGLGAITPNTTYYFAAWSNVDGTWYPGQVLSFTTGDGTIGGTVGGPGVLKVDSVETVKDTATADGTFASGWKYVFNITVPTNESHIAMKFADWAKTGGGGTIPVANNMRISSPQADNSGATILLTAANTYSTPDLHMVTDLNPSMDGIQTKVTVEVAIPAGTVNGAYTTSYGVKSE